MVKKVAENGSPVRKTLHVLVGNYGEFHRILQEGVVYTLSPRGSYEIDMSVNGVLYSTFDARSVSLAEIVSTMPVRDRHVAVEFVGVLSKLCTIEVLSEFMAKKYRLVVTGGDALSGIYDLLCKTYGESGFSLSMDDLKTVCRSRADFVTAYRAFAGVNGIMGNRGTRIS